MRRLRCPCVSYVGNGSRKGFWPERWKYLLSMMLIQKEIAPILEQSVGCGRSNPLVLFMAYLI